jgi:hypothetical protein
MQRGGFRTWQWGILGVLLLVPGTAGAVSFEVPGARLSVSGYLDLQYTYMDRMPMAMGAMIMPMDAVSTLDQNHMNLIVRAERERVTAAVNLHSDGAYSGSAGSGGSVDGHGTWEVLEAYGEYAFSDRARVRGGQFLAPFGHYNQTRYAIALFAPVVLPTLYEPPANYVASGGLPSLVPDTANLMVSGAAELSAFELDYDAYVDSGTRNASGSDTNEAKNVGGRLTLSRSGRAVSASAFWADDGDAYGNRVHLLAGTDLDLGPVNLQAEYLRVTTSTDAADVRSWYARLSLPLGRTTPFLGYDDLVDDANPVYRGGMARWSAGVGHEVSQSVYLKAEYHRHHFRGAAIPSGLKDVDMLRLAAVVVF